MNADGVFLESSRGLDRDLAIDDWLTNTPGTRHVSGSWLMCSVKKRPLSNANTRVEQLQKENMLCCGPMDNSTCNKDS